MNEDWRLRADLHAHGIAGALRERLEASELEHELATAFEHRIVLSVDGSEVFCYAGSREQAEGAGRLIRSLATENGWEVETELKRWHPTAEQWEDPEEALPESQSEQVAEHAELVEGERRLSSERGFPAFEVRVECDSHDATLELAERLQGEGLEVVSRWRYLMLGMPDEDSARALAERLRAEAPAGCKVSTELNLREVYAEEPFNPFALFGGLGG